MPGSAGAALPIETLSWWLLLCSVSVVNGVAWAATARWLHRQRDRLPAERRALARLLLLLSAGYVLGCAWRSALPVFDVPRQVLVDSVWSSALVGRSVATVAELCFAAQWAALLWAASQAVDSAVGRTVARALLPLIGVAELCSWRAVLTTSNLGHVLEETLWGVCAVLIVLALVALWPRCRGAVRPLLAALIGAALAYAVYMFWVDVPMYWTRWVADQAAGKPVLDLGAGVVDAATRRVVTGDWAAWRSEVVWMTLYFSVAVWISIALVRLPAWRAWPVAGLPRTRTAFFGATA